MSGVYIPGMEPPKPDEVIHIYNNGEARKCPLFEQKVIEVSVAIPVPDHGRLVDADQLEISECIIDDVPCDIIYASELYDAQTIIPADVGVKE